MAKKEINVIVDVKSDMEADIVKAALVNIAKYITVENLSVLGESAKKEGINYKIQVFKKYL